ncbi:hypothetical protein AB0877_02875 [Micromonospora sp. NPDC047644]|uniref:hypothetical protein n=1 Tax=Micromonospora sp. NPDC047644 TaxID=3157203 RepID=UPI003453D7FE
MSENAQQRGPDRTVDDADPDVLLDVPKVTVDSIRLAVDGLEADLSLRARVANLLQVDAGVRVHLNGGELNIDGVNAEAQLRVRLEQLTTILGRALDTLDHNPHIIEMLARTAGTAVDDVNRGGQQLAAGAAEIKASSRRSDDVRDEPNRQFGAASPVADRDRLGSDRTRPGRPSVAGRSGPDRHGLEQPELDQPGPGRPDAGRSDAGRSEAGRSEAGPVGSGPGAGGPGPRAGGPGPADQAQPQGQRAEGQRSKGRESEAGPPAAQGSEGQRHERPRRTEEARKQSDGSGPSPSSGGGDGGLPGAAQAAAQSAAQFAEQAGETLREAGRSVWEAIQGSVAQHRPPGRRDH